MVDIKTKDLMALCNVKTIQGMVQWVKQHLARINIDGEHARKVGNEWVFDEVAVNRILELRNNGTIPAAMVTETERIKELTIKQNKLLEQLNAAQASILSHKDKIILMQAQYSSQVVALQESKTKAEAELTKAQVAVEKARADKTIAENKLESLEANYQNKVAELELRNKVLDNKGVELTQAVAEVKAQSAMLASQVQQLKAEKDKLSEELAKEKSKGFWSKLFH